MLVGRHAIQLLHQPASSQGASSDFSRLSCSIALRSADVAQTVDSPLMVRRRRRTTSYMRFHRCAYAGLRVAAVTSRTVRVVIDGCIADPCCMHRATSTVQSFTFNTTMYPHPLNILDRGARLFAPYPTLQMSRKACRFHFQWDVRGACQSEKLTTSIIYSTDSQGLVKTQSRNWQLRCKQRNQSICAFLDTYTGAKVARSRTVRLGPFDRCNLDSICVPNKGHGLLNLLMQFARND